MGRRADKEEAVREAVEGDLALLGTTLVYLRLVSERISAAARSGQQHILGPAADDLRRAGCLVRQVQERIRGREERAL